MNFEETLKKISGLDERAMEQAWAHWDALAKPLRSLGKLEEVIVQIAGIQKTPAVSIDKKCLLVFCADNGIVEEGVTQTGQEVTAQVAENFPIGKTTTSILCQKAGAEICAIDVGVYRDTNIETHKTAYGTRNFLREPAMTKEQAIETIETGIRMAERKASEGVRLLATGEMGIGNTTTSSAIASVLLARPVEEMTGRGAGLSSEGLVRKIRVIREAIDRYRLTKEDPLHVLSCVGGFDIAAMTGVFLAGAALRIPVVIDGFISGVAALTAARICPAAVDFMIPSHISKEPATVQVLEALGKSAFLTCDMRLGEGSGAVVLFPVLDMASVVYHSMATFEENEIESYVPLT